MKYLHSAYKQLTADFRHIWFPAAAAVLYLAISEYYFHTPCPIAILFHFPCPGCGITRACIALLQCRFFDAFRYNAMIFLWIPLVIYFCIFRYFFQKEPPLFLPVCIIMGIATMCYYSFRLISGSAFTLLP